MRRDASAANTYVPNNAPKPFHVYPLDVARRQHGKVTVSQIDMDGRDGPCCERMKDESW
jgi:hypothetical protein